MPQSRRSKIQPYAGAILSRGNQSPQKAPTLTAAAQGGSDKVLKPRQQILLEQTWDKPAAAIFWKPRRGKTAPTILTAQYLWEANKIDAVLLLAPNGIHLNWSQNEIPYWLPKAEIHEWLSSKKIFPGDRQSGKGLYPLIFYCVNIEALQIPELQEYLQKFVQTFRTMLIVDESHNLKSNRFKRTKANKKPRARIVRELSINCPYKRILTGTPSPNGPFDFWSQFYILDPNILGKSITAFKERYGVFEQGYFHNHRVPILKGYQNTEELNAKIQPYISWSDWEGDAPIPVSKKHYFEMTKQQEKLYKQLEEEFYITINKEVITEQHALTRLLRLHQLARGWYQDKPIAPNCALNALEECIDESEKTIIWCHFKNELKYLKEKFPFPMITITAETKPKDRLWLLEEFNKSKTCNILLSTASIIGEGTDISSATHMIFYSNSYDLAEREQALFRFQGDKQKSKELKVTDIIASHSVDLKVLQALEKKQSLAETFRRK